MEDRSAPQLVGGSSSPMRARTAMRVPGDIWCWVLLCVGECNCLLLLQHLLLLQDVSSRVSVTHQGNILENRLYVDCEVRHPEAGGV